MSSVQLKSLPTFGQSGFNCTALSASSFAQQSCFNLRNAYDRLLYSTASVGLNLMAVVQCSTASLQLPSRKHALPSSLKSLGVSGSGDGLAADVVESPVSAVPLLVLDLSLPSTLYRINETQIKAMLKLLRGRRFRHIPYFTGFLLICRCHFNLPPID